MEKNEKDEQLKDNKENKESSDSSKKAGEEDENFKETDEEKVAREKEEADAAAAQKKKDDDAAEAAKGDKKEDKKDDGEDEVAALRRTAREQKKALDATTVELEEMRKALKKAGLVEDEDKETVAKQKEAVALRNATLETMAELMRLNPKYPDFDEVVTEDFADDLMEGMARVLVQNEGLSMREATAKVEEMVWGTTNPYKFLYDAIKTNHPHFKKAAAAKKDEKKEDKKDESAEKKLADLLPKKASSIHEKDGGDGDTAEWTSAKIDALDEDELKQVPRDIYAKYLRGELK